MVFVNSLIGSLVGGIVATILFLIIVIAFLPAITNDVVSIGTQSFFSSFSEFKLNCNSSFIQNSFIIDLNGQKQYCIIEKQLPNIFDKNILT